MGGEQPPQPQYQQQPSAPQTYLQQPPPPGTGYQPQNQGYPQAANPQPQQYPSPQYYPGQQPQQGGPQYGQPQYQQPVYQPPVQAAVSAVGVLPQYVPNMAPQLTAARRADKDSREMPGAIMYSTNTRFLLKQKFFSLGDAYIEDPWGNKVFNVKNTVFSLQDNLRIMSLDNAYEYVQVKQVFNWLLEKYEVWRSGVFIGRIKREMSWFGDKFTIKLAGETEASMEVRGNILAMEYTINHKRDNRIVSQVSKKWFSFRDTYAIDIFPGEDVTMYLALAIVLERIMLKRRRAEAQRHNNMND